MAIKVLVAHATSEGRRYLEDLLKGNPDVELVGSVEDGGEVLELVGPLRVDIVFLDINIPGVDAFTVTERITTRFPDTGVIIVSADAHPEEMRRAMLAGASDYLLEPVMPSDLQQSLNKVYQRLQGLRRSLGPTALPEDESPPKVVAIYSPQGGVGKSLLAANLAVCLAQESGRPTVLIDLNLEFGNLDLLLNVTPDRTIASVIPRLNQLDAELMESFLTEHAESRLKVLAAPTRPEYADTITVVVVERVIQVLKQRYKYVIIDTPSTLRDTTLTALDLADMILLLTTLDLLALRNTRLALEMMEKLRYPEEKVKLVLNRADSDVGITPEDVEEALRYSISAKIPSDGRVAVTSVNEGVPFVLSHPNSKIAQAVRYIAYMVMGREEEWSERAEVEQPSRAPARSGFWEFLFGAPRKR